MEIIVYYRLSTRRQGESGLGLEGQKATVEAFSVGRTGRILAEYTEVESGRKPSRPELLKALAPLSAVDKCVWSTCTTSTGNRAVSLSVADQNRRQCIQNAAFQPL